MLEIDSRLLDPAGKAEAIVNLNKLLEMIDAVAEQVSALEAAEGEAK